MDISTILDNYGELLQVFVPPVAIPFVPVILIVIWVTYQFAPNLKRIAPILALILGQVVSFLFLEMHWRQAIPTGLTLGGYVIATWELGKIKLKQKMEGI